MARSGREVPEGPRLPKGMERSGRAIGEARMEHEREEKRYSDYFVLDIGSFSSWMISREMAAFVERELDRWPRPRWIKFVDVAGARVRLRSELIRSLRQSSAEIRDEYRRFSRERDEESKDESWDWDID